MVHQEERGRGTAGACAGGLRGRFRRSFDCMENAFEVLQDRSGARGYTRRSAPS